MGKMSKFYKFSPRLFIFATHIPPDVQCELKICPMQLYDKYLNIKRGYDEDLKDAVMT